MGEHQQATQIKLTFVVNHAAFFVSHRLPIAREALRRGYLVRLVTGQAGSATMEPAAERVLAQSGIDHTRVGFGSSSINPLTELVGLAQLIWTLREHKPDVVHCVSPKGLIYGGLAARILGVPAIVMAISGMGYASSSTKKKSVLRRFVSIVHRSLSRLSYGHRNKKVIVQNLDDERTVTAAGLARSQDVVRIPGSGVNISIHANAAIEDKLPTILLPARMLVDKGVNEFVAAARLLRGKTDGWRFVLAGAADYKNPSAISAEQIQLWVDEGVVEWLGHVEDMVPQYARASIVCLPSSYGEGMPKSLLEAAAAGCAVVTTDSTGCREAIIAGKTGDLVPIGDTAALAAALLSLVKDRARRERYGLAGRALARDRFSIEAVVKTTLDIYESLLQHD